jgi:hypothetical protein
MQKAADNILTLLWGLMEGGQEELKLLQTAILLITTNFVVQHESLAKVKIVIGKLLFSPPPPSLRLSAGGYGFVLDLLYTMATTE